MLRVAEALIGLAGPEANADVVAVLRIPGVGHERRRQRAEDVTTVVALDRDGALRAGASASHVVRALETRGVVAVDHQPHVGPAQRARVGRHGHQVALRARGEGQQASHQSRHKVQKRGPKTLVFCLRLA